MNKDKLSRLERAGIWATIIGCVTSFIMCIIAFLGWFSQLPDKKNTETNRPTHSTIVDEKNTPEYILEHEIWEKMTTWEKITLPFIKHEKMNYHKYEWDEKGWRVSIGYLAIIGLLLIGILGFGAYSLGYFDGADSSGNLYGKILSGGIAIVLLIYLILRILVQFGFY